jgi:tetratricopeptide (TPR) repeat protein
MRRRLLLAGVAAGLLAAAGLLGGALAGSSSTAAEPGARPAAAADTLLDGVAPGDTAAYVEALEARVAEGVPNAEDLTLLGLAYQQRARETGDPSFYPRSEEALRRALRLEPRNGLAVTGLASLAASRHRFEEARALAERAARLAPHSAAPQGILGDALAELGRYRGAFAAWERMASVEPDAAAYARISYARELLGRPRAALDAMELAVGAASVRGEHAAWALVQAGNLRFAQGSLGPAARSYREALVRFPGYAAAQAGLAHVEAARERTERAVALYRKALEAVPLPEYAAGLGETLAASGRRAEAEKAYALVDATQRLLEANGVRTDLETALVSLDRGRDLPGALARAREAYEERRSIQAEDVLAWALYRNGRCEEADVHSRRALRLGTRDALLLFHRGMIERCLGNAEGARSYLGRALATNPHFSLRWAPVAAEALR